MFDVNVDNQNDLRNFFVFVGILTLAIVLIVIYISFTSEDVNQGNNTIIYPQGYAGVEDEDTGEQKVIVNQDNINKSDREIRNELGIDETVTIERPAALQSDRPFPIDESLRPPLDNSGIGD